MGQRRRGADGETAGSLRERHGDFSETYDTKNVGTGKTLTPSGSVNDGNSGNNYTITFVTNTTGVITAAPSRYGSDEHQGLRRDDHARRRRR